MNLQLARGALQALIESGVEEFIVCPGSRNAPLMNVLLNEDRLTKTYAFDERSAAFFALGKAKSKRRPVAVVTTSGTAAGELLPAAMEAYYTSIPLVLITADRPKRMRFLNAPQTANQKDIFGIYTPVSLDIDKDTDWDIQEWRASTPLHMNICFEEPEKTFIPTEPLSYPVFKMREALYTGDYKKIDEFLNQATDLSVMVSALPIDARDSVEKFLLNLGAECYLEATSGLREKKSLQPLSLFDPVNTSSVLRIGGVPTHSLWRSLNGHVLSITEDPFSGLEGSDMIQTPVKSFFENYTPPSKPSIRAQKEKAPYSQEEQLIHRLSQIIPEGSLVYLGNSLPIREWDKAAVREDKRFDIYASRGLNGIDGQISTFLGLAEPGRSNWGIFGDLTALYDLSAPWFLSKMAAKDINIVIINNSGGRIFEKMYNIPEMINSHNYSFKSLADLWQIPYESGLEIKKNIITPFPRIIELTV